MNLDRWATEIVGVMTAIVGLAIVAVILSKKADTSNVIGAAGKALADTIGAAVKPVT
jgi:hypothetical protein